MPPVSLKCPNLDDHSTFDPKPTDTQGVRGWIWIIRLHFNLCGCGNDRLPDRCC